MVFRSGEYIASNLNPGGPQVPSEAVQPAGVDIRINSIYRVTGVGVLSDEGDYSKGERVEVNPHTRRSFDQQSDFDAVQALRKLKIRPDDPRQFYFLDPSDVYVVEYDEVISIPENHVGFIYPRSRLIRSGGMLYTALWDPGYEGRGEGQLVVNNSAGLVIEDEMRIGQLVLAKTSDLSVTYNGTHQGENLSGTRD